MLPIDFCELLAQEISDTNNISISITKAKGIITLFWSVTFLDKSNQDYFNLHLDEIEWANLKMQYIAKKYNQYHIKTKILTEDDAIYFDHYWATTKQAPVKRAIQTDTMSFGGYVQFVFKE